MFTPKTPLLSFIKFNGLKLGMRIRPSNARTTLRFEPPTSEETPKMTSRPPVASAA